MSIMDFLIEFVHKILYLFHKFVQKFNSDRISIEVLLN